MVDWLPTYKAPLGKVVEVKTAGGVTLLASFQDGFMRWENNEDIECGGWVAADGEDYPECWSEGVCWRTNADEITSDPVIGWRPDPSPIGTGEQNDG